MLGMPLFLIDDRNQRIPDVFIWDSGQMLLVQQNGFQLAFDILPYIIQYNLFIVAGRVRLQRRFRILSDANVILIRFGIAQGRICAAG